MREKEFDILKGIGILLVVIGHTGISGLPYTYIYSFHMPLFFFVSGCFYKRRPLIEVLERKAKSLLLPWMSFAMLFFIAYTVIDAIKMQNLPEALSVNLSALNLMDEHCTLFRSIWFLVCLFEVSVFYALLDRMPSYLKWGG